MAVELTYSDPVKTGQALTSVISGILKNGETSIPLQLPDYPDKTISIGGASAVFNSATVVVRDKSSTVTLDDNIGTALSFIANGCKVIAQNPAEIEVVVSGGDASTSIPFEFTCVKHFR